MKRIFLMALCLFALCLLAACGLQTPPEGGATSPDGGITPPADAEYKVTLILENDTATVTSDTTDIILIRISREGPTVSWRGSPTVSPTTEASCAPLALP